MLKDNNSDNKDNKDNKDNELNLAFDDVNRYQIKSSMTAIRHDSDDFDGDEFLCQLQPGILLRVVDFSVRVQGQAVIRRQSAIPAHTLTLSFKLAGENIVSLADDNSDAVKAKQEERGIDFIAMRERSLWVSYGKDAVMMVDESHHQEKYLLVQLMCDPKVLCKAPFDLQPDQLPHCIASVINGQEFMTADFTLTDELMQALYILLKSDTSDPFCRAFLQAKTVELMCLALRNVTHQERQQEQNHISEKEREQMSKAGQLLAQNLRSPPTQEALVQTLGIGKSRLKRCFKALYGCSITDYILHARVQHARQLLTQGRLNVTQVAMEVGYEHVGNFTTMFKRQLGITPKAFQLMNTGQANR